MGQEKQKMLDESTGFPVGFHGGYSHAVDWALDHEPDDGLEFLRQWRTGDLADYPDYYEWLRSIGVTG